MLRLSRDITETIMIGDNIEVKVLGVQGSTVHIGIRAPKFIPVHRREVYDRIKIKYKKPKSYFKALKNVISF